MLIKATKIRIKATKIRIKATNLLDIVALI